MQLEPNDTLEPLEPLENLERDARAALAAPLLEAAMRIIWGDLLDTEGMRGTPARVAKHWVASTVGLHQDPALPLRTTFPCAHDEIVIVKDIPFHSVCEHHLLPFSGVAHIGYIPQKSVVGLSKLPRCLDVIAARPQMQERITREVADLIHTTLNAQGTIVVLEASHACMTCRGVLKGGSVTITSAVLGLFQTDIAARAEVFTLIR